MNGTKEIKEYFEMLNEKIESAISIAKKAKLTKKDLSEDIEMLPAKGIAEKTEILVGPSGVAKIYNELWEKYKDRFKVIIDIFNKIIDGELGNFENDEKKLEQAIRTALIIETEGVVVSPIDGLPEIKLSENKDGSKFVDIYYAGPIRAAGGNAQTLPLLLADLARQKLHIDRYKPSKKEVDRIIEEAMIYQTEIVVRQQRVNENDIRVIVENCPIKINSYADSKVEVITHRDIEGTTSNRVRGAMCLVLIDGLYVRAMKILKTSKKINVNWNWLEQIIKVKKTSEDSFQLKPSTKYLEGLMIGRPIFAYPLTRGGFRLRYGRCRNTGLMGKAVNPATMYVLDSFIAVGTQCKVERPGKSLQFFPCTTIDGPIVRLKDKSVIQINDYENAKKYYEEIEKILFVGDILVSLGDFRKSGHPLLKSGYVEEEWLAEIKYLYGLEKIDKKAYSDCLEFYEKPNPYTAISLCISYGVSLFPKYTSYYSFLNNEELKKMIEELRNCEKVYDDKKIVGAKIKYSKEIKEIFEKIGLPHKVLNFENIEINENYAYPLLKVFGALNANEPLEEFKELFLKEEKNTLEKISEISKIKINEKAGTFIGVRMGRPEASHSRVIKGKPHVLFPIGKGFGNSKDLIKISFIKKEDAKTYGVCDVRIVSYYCENCKNITYHNYCFKCNQKTKMIRFCENCNKDTFEEICEHCKKETKIKDRFKVRVDELLKKAYNNLSLNAPTKLNGVSELNGIGYAEPLEKGILRAKYDLNVFRDGTIRYEALNATLSQFCAKEINLNLENIEKLKYKIDYEGKNIKSETQRLSIYPQDIIVNEDCGEFLLKVSWFIDELLEKYYGLNKFYEAKTKEDLIGHLVIALAPHTSAGIVGRIIGYTKSKLAWGHPYFITAKRRNVDGDQDSMMLLMDGLLNFSKKYLSDRRGGKMDAALAFTTNLNPYEIDDEAYEIETCKEYDYDFYKKSKIFEDPDDACQNVVKNKLGSEEQYTCIKFTHDTECFDIGPKKSTYITIKSATDKLNKQLSLQKKIKAVDLKDSLERLLHYHLFPDIIGNTRSFARQKLRCVKCNAKYRRIPLSGVCSCGGKLILTIAEGSIKKYINAAKSIISDNDLKTYLYHRITLCENEIASLFSNEDELKQKSLSEFF